MPIGKYYSHLPMRMMIDLDQDTINLLQRYLVCRLHHMSKGLPTQKISLPLNAICS